MEKRFKDMNQHIRPMDDLSEQVMVKATGKQFGWNLRPLAAVAAVLALLIAATPTMAVNVPLVHDVLNRIAPELTDRLVPVQLSDEDNGIQMEVVAASVRDNVAEWVIKIEGEALKGWTFVDPLMKIRDHSGMFGGATTTDGESLNDYDEVFEDREKGIWYYRYQKTYPEGTAAEKILGDRMTIRLSGVLLTNIGKEGVEVPVIFTDYELMTVERDRWPDYGFSRFGGGGIEETVRTMMKPGERVYDVTDKLSLTGAAYMDGKLHIQTAGVDQIIGSSVEWGYMRPYFVDADGNKTRDLYHYSCAIKADGHETEYVECVFDIPEEELENYTMVIELIDDDAVASNCSVTFEIADVTEPTEQG